MVLEQLESPCHKNSQLITHMLDKIELNMVIELNGVKSKTKNL